MCLFFSEDLVLHLSATVFLKVIFETPVAVLIFLQNSLTVLYLTTELRLGFQERMHIRNNIPYLNVQLLEISFIQTGGTLNVPAFTHANVKANDC
jgi:hypothetical protein